jgi:hypothetical protein
MCHSPRKEYYKKFLFEPLPGGWAGSWQALDDCEAACAALCGCILPLQLCPVDLTMLRCLSLPFPALPAVESHLDHFLHDHMAAEVVTR